MGQTIETKWRQQLDLNRIDAQTKADLKELGKVLRPQLPKIVDAFYDHLAKFREPQAIIERAGSSIEKLRKTNPQYFEKIFEGEFSQDYFESRNRIGVIHAKVQLEPAWFFGAMTAYYDAIFPMIVKAYRFSPAKAGRALASLQKAFNLDQALILDAYIEGSVAELIQVTAQTTEIIERLRHLGRTLKSTADESGSAVQDLSEMSQQLASASTNQAGAAQNAAAAMSALSERSAAMLKGATTQSAALERSHWPSRGGLC